ncbi:MAG: hypothetical protein FWB71_01405 [Defluviitaleaceae bacterium]|nr:hypothetical protein [Defluviitaleaceae bacterium]
MTINKLPYPTFLETFDAKITQENVEIWAGKCIFTPRLDVARGKDGTDEAWRARAQIRQQIGQATNIEMIITRAGEDMRFIVEKAEPIHNPDGSLHHTGLDLIAV